MIRRNLWILLVIVLLIIWFAVRKRVFHDHTPEPRPPPEPASEVLPPDGPVAGVLPAAITAQRSHEPGWPVIEKCRWQQPGRSARTNSTARAALSMKSAELSTNSRRGVRV